MDGLWGQRDQTVSARTEVMSSGKTLIFFVSQFPHMSNGAAVIVLVMGLWML